MPSLSLLYKNSRNESSRSPQIFSEHAFCPGHECGLLNSQAYTWECPSFSKKLFSYFSQALSVPLFSWTIIFCPRQQWVVTCFIMFSRIAYCFSDLTEIHVRQNKDKHLLSVFQVAPRQVGTEKHNFLRWRYVLLPLELGTKVPNSEYGLLFSRLMLSKRKRWIRGK